jgi:hypothetical protein
VRQPSCSFSNLTSSKGHLEKGASILGLALCACQPQLTDENDQLARGLDAIRDDDATREILTALEAMGCPLSLATSALEAPEEATGSIALSFKKLCIEGDQHTASNMHFVIAGDGEIVFAGGYRENYEADEEGLLVRSDFFGIVRQGSTTVDGLDVLAWRQYLPDAYEGATYLATGSVPEQPSIASLPIVDNGTAGARPNAAGETCKKCLDAYETASLYEFVECLTQAQDYHTDLKNSCDWPGPNSFISSEKWEELVRDGCEARAREWIGNKSDFCNATLNPASARGRDATSAHCSSVGSCGASLCDQASDSCSGVELSIIEDGVEVPAPYCALVPAGTHRSCCTAIGGDESMAPPGARCQ